MAKAKRPGGLYYVGETAVDAEGRAVTNAPPPSPNTEPSLQPGSLNAPTSEDRLASALTKSLAPLIGKAKGEK